MRRSRWERRRRREGGGEGEEPGYMHGHQFSSVYNTRSHVFSGRERTTPAGLRPVQPDTKHPNTG